MSTNRWPRVLASVPDSRLLMKTPASDDRLVASEIRALARAAGIPTDRFELRPLIAEWKDQFAVFGDVDVVLDTVPYAGTTTTCEALWMGVPVVTLLGNAMISRQSAALLGPGRFRSLHP